MAWPKNTDYHEAIQNPHASFHDEELRGGEVAGNALGLPMLWAGNFADVYKIHCPATGNTWAVKCFTREVRHLQERYRSIAEHLEQARLPFTVDFQYLDQGIRIAGAWFPILKMRWVQGLTLDQFVKEHLDRPKNLKMLLDLWVKLAARLRDAHMAHADLQHGNVLLIPMDRGALGLRLIDYDGMYVPSLAGMRSGELGHPAYQHPRRLSEKIYNGEVDRFSHLVIYTSVRCLSVGRRESWRQFNNGDNLLFREVDFAAPHKSPAFHAFWQSGDQEVRTLIGRLALACGQRLEEVPWLDRVVDKGHAVPLTQTEEKEVNARLAVSVQIPVAQAVPQTVAYAPGGSRPAGMPPLPVAAGMPPLPDTRVVPVAALTGTTPVAAAGTVPRMDGLGGPSYNPATARTVSSVPRRLLSSSWRVLSYLFNRNLVDVVRDAGRFLPKGATAVARRIDWLFRRIVGEENDILRYFLWTVTPLLLLAAVWFAVSSLPRRSPSPQIANNSLAEPVAELKPPQAEPQATSAAPKKLAVDLGNGVNLEMVLIPAGEFMMGDDNATRSVHKVSINKPFYLGKHEVTQEQWEAVMGSNPSFFKGPKNPVENVSWDDCQQFLDKLTAKAGGQGDKFVLPSEAQWEYACRAGSMTRYSFGDEDSELGEYAWYSANSNSKTHPVGEKKPNAWGLYDMHGNVWEWCEDWCDSGYFMGSPTPTYGLAKPTTGSDRVYRGGCWSYPASNCWSASRNSYKSGNGITYLGLRVSRVSVEAVTAPLKIQPIASRTIEAGKPLSVVVAVEDAPRWTGIHYSLAPNSPPGATINPESGEFSWTPPSDQAVGQQEISVSAIGREGQKTQSSFIITVTQSIPTPVVLPGKETAVDHKPPIIRQISPQTVEAGTPLSVEMGVEDAARWEGKLQYSLTPKSLPDASIDPQSGEFSWTPPLDYPAGRYNVTVSVEGPDHEMARTTFGVTVTKPEPPKLETSAKKEPIEKVPRKPVTYRFSKKETIEKHWKLPSQPDKIIEPDFPKARIQRTRQPEWQITNSGLELSGEMSGDFDSTFDISGDSTITVRCLYSSDAPPTIRLFGETLNLPRKQTAQSKSRLPKKQIAKSESEPKSHRVTIVRKGNQLTARVDGGKPFKEITASDDSTHLVFRPGQSGLTLQSVSVTGTILK